MPVAPSNGLRTTCLARAREEVINGQILCCWEEGNARLRPAGRLLIGERGSRKERRKAWTHDGEPETLLIGGGRTQFGSCAIDPWTLVARKHELETSKPEDGSLEVTAAG